ncbi:MAG: hypothetical protein ACKOBW_01165 [Planctomycetota bacterium]
MTPQRKLHRSPRPRGISLVEMILSITLIAAALTLIGRVTLQLGRLERTMNEERLADEAWRRLSRDFRADAHDAQLATTQVAVELKLEADAQAQVDAQPARNRDVDAGVRFLRADDSTAEYSVAPAGVVRIVRRGERVIHRERYFLGSKNWVQFRLRNSALASERFDQVGTWAEITGGDTTELGERRVSWRILTAMPTEVARRRPRRRRQRGETRRGMLSRRRMVRRRRGAVLAAALVALLIITMFSAILIRRAYLARLQTRLANQRLQASWVVESMMRRAMLRAEKKPTAESLRLVIPTTPSGSGASDNTIPGASGASEKAASEKAASEKTPETKSGTEKSSAEEVRIQPAREREVWYVTIDLTEVPGESSTWNLQVTARLGEETRPLVVERRARRVKLGQNLPQPKEGNDES